MNTGAFKPILFNEANRVTIPPLSSDQIRYTQIGTPNVNAGKEETPGSSFEASGQPVLRPEHGLLSYGSFVEMRRPLPIILAP